MTEKQFIFISNTVATNLKTPISHNNKTMSIGEVLEKLNDLADENKKLKKDATILIYSNQDYRQENENLKKQLDYIQNSINEHIKHQKTELVAKALKEIIKDYNEWMLGHKGDKRMTFEDHIRSKPMPTEPISWDNNLHLEPVEIKCKLTTEEKKKILLEAIKEVQK